MRKYRCESDIYGKENWAVTRSVNPQVPGSSPGRGARIQKSPAFTGWAFCFPKWFGIGSADPHLSLALGPLRATRKPSPG